MPDVADSLIEHQLRESAPRRTRLTEDRLPALHKKWAEINTDHDTMLHQSRRRAAQRSDVPYDEKAGLAHHVVNTVAHHIDPTPNQQYTDQALHWYHQGQYRLEDSDRVHKALKTFHAQRGQLKQEHAAELTDEHENHKTGVKTTTPRVKDVGNINSYKSIHDLEHVLGKADPKPKIDTPWTKTTAAQRSAVEHGSEVVHDDKNLTVRAVRNHDAMKVLGSNTSWCVVPDKHTWEEYDEEGPLYHIHDKQSGERRLLHFPSGQFMDEKDEPADADEFAKHHPVMKQLFHGKHYDMFSDKAKLDQEVIAGKHFGTAIGAQTAQSSKNPDTLHALRGAYPEQVSATRHAHPHTLDDIARDRRASRNTRHHVAANEKATPDTLTYLYATASQPGRDKADVQGTHHELARNESTPGPILTKIATADYTKEPAHGLANHTALASNSSAPAAALHAVADSRKDITVFNKIAANRGADAGVLDKVGRAYGSHVDVAERLARHPNTSSETLHSLVKDGVPSKTVGMYPGDQSLKQEATLHSIAKHPNASRETLGVIRGLKPHWSTSDAMLHSVINSHQNADPAWKQSQRNWGPPLGTGASA